MLSAVFWLFLSTVHPVVDVPGTRGILVPCQLVSILLNRHHARGILTPQAPIVGTAHAATQIVTAVGLQLIFNALCVKEMSLTVAHLDYINGLHIAHLLLVKLLNCCCAHVLYIFIELTVAYGAVLLLKLAPVYLVNWYFLLL